jgi:multidrug resistance efflux pump
VNPGEIVAVARGRVEKSVESSGKVVANLEVDIKCRASGEVTKLPFDISQAVKKGDLLCQLDPTDEQLAVRSGEAMVAQSTAKLAQARADLRQAEENLVTTRRKDEATLASAKVKAVNLRAKADRQKQLIVQNLGSREDCETAETDAATADAARIAAEIAIDELKQQEIQVEYKRQAVKVAEAQLQSDQVTLDNQRQQLAYTTVTSPIDGVVSALNVQKGTIVASGMNGFSGGTTMMTLSDLSHVFVIATVDESDIGQVRVGQPARVTVASFPGRTFVGQVVRIATKGVNSSNVVTFEVKVEVLDERKDLLRPEMTGNITIIQAEKPDVLTLPSTCLIRQGGQVFVTLAGGERRLVKLGLEGAEFVEILAGVTLGDRVIVTTANLPTRWKSQDRGPGGGPPPQ